MKTLNIKTVWDDIEWTAPGHTPMSPALQVTRLAMFVLYESAKVIAKSISEVGTSVDKLADAVRGHHSGAEVIAAETIAKEIPPRD